jgi:hypothetical protein
METTSEGVWQGDNPLHFALPLLILQICLVVVVTRSLGFVLKPLRQPRVIAEIIVCYVSINKCIPVINSIHVTFLSSICLKELIMSLKKACDICSEQKKKVMFHLFIP